MSTLHCPTCGQLVCTCPGSDAAPLASAHRLELELHALRRRVVEDRARYHDGIGNFGLAVVEMAIGGAPC